VVHHRAESRPFELRLSGSHHRRSDVLPQLVLRERRRGHERGRQPASEWVIRRAVGGGVGLRHRLQTRSGFWYGAASAACPIAMSGDVNLSTTITSSDIIVL